MCSFICKKPGPYKRSLDLGDGETVAAWKNITSEYSSVYRELPRSTASAIIPHKNEEFIYNLKSPLDHKTSYEQSFVRHPLATRHNVRIPDLETLGSEEFLNGKSMKSTYCDTFVPKTTLIPALCLPDPPENKVLEQGSDFDPKPTHHSTEFRRYTLPECVDAKRKMFSGEGGRIFSSGEIRPCYSTTTASTYKKPQQLVKLVPIIHKPEIELSESEMDLETTQRADYVDKDVGSSKDTIPLCGSSRPALFSFERDQPYKPRTTSEDDFQAYAPRLHRPKSFKPFWQFTIPSDPFPKLSVYKEDFMKLPTDVNDKGLPLLLSKPKNNLKLEEETETPTKQSHYKEIFHTNSVDGGEKATVVMPRLAHVFPVSSERFSTDTSYGMTYKKFSKAEVSKVRTILRKAEYHASKEKFVGETTSKRHFQWHYVPPRKLIKPIEKQTIDFAVPIDPL